MDAAGRDVGTGGGGTTGPRLIRVRERALRSAPASAGRLPLPDILGMVGEM